MLLIKRKVRKFCNRNYRPCYTDVFNNKNFKRVSLSDVLLKVDDQRGEGLLRRRMYKMAVVKDET